MTQLPPEPAEPAPAMTDRTPDPGSPGAARIALIIGGALYLIVALLQRAPAPAPETGEEASGAAATIQAPQPGDMFTISCKLSTRMVHALGPVGGAPGPIAESLAQQASTPLERLRVAVVLGELVGPERALTELDGIEPGPDDPLLEDVRILRSRYQNPDAPLSPGESRFLVERHGWFGELADVLGKARDDPQTRAVLGGPGFAGVLISLVLGALAIGACALVLFVVAIVLLALGRIRPAFRASAPGGSIMLETFAVFVGGFLVIKLIVGAAGALAGEDADWPVYLAMCAQWLVLLTLLWPLVRGVPMRRLADLIGWQRGKGVLTEIGAGVLGYIAGLPIVFFATIITLVLLYLKQAVTGDTEPPANPIMDLAAAGSPILLILMFALATIWAPIAEEAIFRGALYRQLRGRVGVLTAVAITALLFAFMHGYSVLILGQVVALGVNFALLREWRGSLIAPMTAHFLHNAAGLSLMFLMLRAVG